MQLSNWFRNKSQRKARESRRSHVTNKVGRGQRQLRHEPLEQRELLSVTPVGGPFLVNQSVGLNQRLADLGLPTPLDNTGFARRGNEESNRSVAVDHNGDFVVTWTVDSGGDINGSAVYMRLFNNDGTPRTSEMLVNTFEDGNQKNANVAMDADGDFVIVWQSEFQDPYDHSSGIFGQRFAANGTRLGSEFRVHTTTVGDQVNPEVAMDYDGNFVVTWENESQYASFFNDVRAQKFTFDGERLGSEIRVNNFNVPGTLPEANPSVAMSPAGDYVVAWSEFGDVYARVFRTDSTPYGSQFRVNVSDMDTITILPGDPGHDPVLPSLGQIQRNAQVAMDSQGNFTVVWESYGDNDYVPPGGTDVIDSYGVYFRRYHLVPDDPDNFPDGVRAAEPVDSQVNPVFTAFSTTPDPDNPIFASTSFVGPQVNGHVAMDASGNLVFTYDGRGNADYFNSGPNGDGLSDYPSGVGLDSQGVYVERFHAAASFDVKDEFGNFTQIETPGNINGTPNSVNTSAIGAQLHSSVAMEPDGDFIVVYDGQGTGDSQGIFARRYNESQDAAGPYATDVLMGGVRVGEGDELLTPVSQLTVSFDEEINTFGGQFGVNSVTNPNNWELLRDGVPVFNAINNVTFGFNNVSKKWEAVVTVDGNGPLPGTSPLMDGNYQLVAKNTIRDVPGNPLQSSGFLSNGGAFGRSFSVQLPTGVSEELVNTTIAGDQVTHRESPKTIASDADGNQVVVWTSIGQDGSDAGVYAQRYAPDGSKLGSEFRVNTLTNGPQDYASVAMDGDGDFVVTWSSYSGDPTTGWDVYARRFDSAGNAINDTEFLVNTETESIQRFSTAAMDVNGDFVITWQSFQQDGEGYGIYAQRYNSSGDRVGGVDEVQSLSISGAATGGSFTLNFDGNIVGPIAYSTELNGTITAANIESAMAPFANVTVEAFTNNEFEIRFAGNDGNRDEPQILLDANNLTGGDTSIELDTPINGVAGEFLVNDTTANNQVYPSVDMDANGVFVITWTSFGQNGDQVFESNILAKRFASNDDLPDTSGLNRALSGTATPPTAPDESQMMYFEDVGASSTDFNLLGSKWAQPGGLGSDVTITYSYSNLFDGTIPLSQAQLRAVTTEALDVWAQYAPLNFVEVADSGPVPDNADTNYAVDDHPDIRFGYHQGFSSQMVLAHAFAPPTSAMDGLGGDVHLNSENDFSDINLLLETLVHEIGHALGLAHANGDVVNGVCPPPFPAIMSACLGGGGTWMYNGLGTAYLLPDDINGIQELYGARSAFGGMPLGPEFVVNSTTTNNQMFSDVAMDLAGDFAITFNSYGNDGGGNGYGPGQGGQNGIFVRRYGSDGNPIGDQFQANTYTDRNQQYSRVAMDANGDFTVVWESYQDDLDNNGQPDSYGIYGQRFLRNGLVLGLADPRGAFGGEFRLNTTVDGQQRFPGVAMDNEGDFTVVWSGPGVGDTQGIFSRRFMISDVQDDAGPIVTDVIVDGNQVKGGDIVEALITNFVVDFGEAVESTPGFTNSIRNLNNWSLTRNGVPLTGVFLSVDETVPNPADPGFNPATNKYQWKISLDSDPETDGVQPLTSGTYTLTISDRVEDLAGNRLDGNFDGTPGGSYNITFDVIGFSAGGVGETPDTPVSDETGKITGFDQGNRPVSASDASGDFVIAWTQGADIAARMYSVAGLPLSGQFTVNTFTDGTQGHPDVASDDAGNFVVVWEGQGPTEEDPYGIYGQLYDRFGAPVGVQFLINTYTKGLQSQPSVAMDSDGDFAVSWTSYDQDGDVDGIFMQRFNRFGDAVGTETRVNTNTTSYQSDSDIAIDGAGDFVVVWQSFGQDGSAWGVYGQRYASDGTRQGGEFRVNNTTVDDQRDPAVALDRDGDFVVTWSSFGQDGSGYGVYGRRFSKDGTPLGNEFQVNQTTVNYQQYSDVDTDFAGNFTVTWTSWNQDGDLNGVFARSYNADGSDAVNIALGTLLGEQQVNQTFLGNQLFSTVSVDANGDQVIAWLSVPVSGGGGDIYFQQFSPGVVTVTGTSTTDVLTFNATDGSFVFNGQTYQVDPAIGVLRFDGGGGNDVVNLIGTSGDDTAVLRAGSAELRGGGFVVMVSNVESINVTSGGGNDSAMFEGTSSVDHIVASPSYTELQVAGYTSMETGFAQVQANSNGGLDQALMVDSNGNPWSSTSPHPNVPVLNGTWQSNMASALNGPSNEAFLTGLYQEALGRTPDVSGFNSWLTQLNTGTPREDVANGFWHSRERAGQVVENAYQSLLDRGSDKRGREYWIDRTMAGLTAEDLTVIFVTSTEYVSNHSSDSSYVDALYQDILGRAADSGGHDYYVGQLGQGMTRENFARSLYGSTEMQTKMIDYYYGEILNRSAEDTALSYYLNFIESGQGNADDVAVSLLASDEFFANVN